MKWLSSFSSTHRGFPVRDDVVTWNAFRITRGIDRWMVDSHHKVLVMLSFGNFVILGRNKLLNKRSVSCYMRSLELVWRHCDVFLKLCSHLCCDWHCCVVSSDLSRFQWYIYPNLPRWQFRPGLIIVPVWKAWTIMVNGTDTMSTRRELCVHFLGCTAYTGLLHVAISLRLIG